jgi:hypothetical protein
LKQFSRVSILASAFDDAVTSQNRGAPMTNESDYEMRCLVLGAIDSIPSVKTGEFEVYVKDSVITLIGRVNSYQALFDIESRVSKISGILGLQTYIQSDVDTFSERRQMVKERRCTVRERRCSNSDLSSQDAPSRGT